MQMHRTGSPYSAANTPLFFGERETTISLRVCDDNHIVTLSIHDLSHTSVSTSLTCQVFLRHQEIMTNLAIATAALPEAAVEFPLECRASFCPGVAPMKLNARN